MTDNWRSVVLASVAMVCVTALIHGRMTAPYRYEFRDSGPEAYTAFDKQAGKLYIRSSIDQRTPKPN